MVREIGCKQASTEEGKRLLVLVNGRFEKLRVIIAYFGFLDQANFCSPDVLINMIYKHSVYREIAKNTRKSDDIKVSCYKACGSCYFVLFRFSSAVVCPKLTVPDNGGVVPSSCSQTDVEYGTRCVFYCNDGYELSGPRYTGCQNDTSWSEIAPLSCVRGQFSGVCCLLLRHNF